MFLKYPNLPDKKVTIAAVSAGETDVIKALSDAGITVIRIENNSYLERKISSHPDMNLLMLGDGKYIAYEKLLPCRFEFIKEEIPISDKYKFSSKLNVAIIGKFCICNKSTATEYIDRLFQERIYVKQGYSKCSVLVIDKDSIITGDIGIYDAAIQNGLNALKCKNDEIFLKGYNNGFIGGVGGKLNYDILAVSGDIKKISDYENIKSFCRNSGVYIEPLTKNILSDIGGIIPIETE